MAEMTLKITISDQELIDNGFLIELKRLDDTIVSKIIVDTDLIKDGDTIPYLPIIDDEK